MTLETFDDVVRAIEKNRGRKFHLLLGNGFSMAYDPKIFSYNALHEFVKTLDNDLVARLFEIVDTTDFERIMQHLDVLLRLCDVFDPNETIRPRVLPAKEALQKGLIDAVKALHPEHVYKVPQEACDSCTIFLKRFLEAGGSLFTTNYDLLLYWILMRGGLSSIDGFGRDREDDGDEHTPGAEREYSSELRSGRNADGQNVFYLHGALPIFDTGIDVIKEQYAAEAYLLAKIKERVERGHYPVFVTAGDGAQKLENIRHNHYLNDCYSHLEQLDGSLVTFGFNFGAQDEHIIRAINIAAKQPKGSGKKLWSIYIGVYSEADQARIEGMRNRFKCKLHIFDSKTAPVWREAGDA